MRKTVYVFEEGAVVNKAGSHIQVRAKDEIAFDEPIANIDAIIIFTYAQITTQALAAALEQGINVVYTTKSSKVVGYTYQRQPQRPLLRLAQYKTAADRHASLCVARNIVSAKIAGQRNTLAAYRMKEEASLKPLQCAALSAKDNTQAMGFEGAAAALYFRSFSRCLKHMGFERREARPAHDPVNALLNLTYSLALSKVDSILFAHGFDTAIGFLHTSANDRSALSLDLLEPFRGMLDRFVLKIVNRHEVCGGDFQGSDAGCVLTKKGFGKYINAYSRDIALESRMEQFVDRLKEAITIEGEVDRLDFKDLHSLL